jgi:insertion element IS1 protein InsB
MAEVTGRLSLLPRRVHERARQDVWRARQLSAQVDSSLCHRALRQTCPQWERDCHGARRDVAFPPKKRRKLWIWKARDRATGQLLDWECGRRDQATLKRLVDRLNQRDVTFYCTDHWKTYAAVIPAEKLVMSKAKTHGIERNHCRQRHWFGRFKRRSIIVSRAKEMVDLTMALFARFRVNGDVSEIFTLSMIT